MGLFAASLQAQEVRSYNGTDNNLQNPEWGAVNTVLPRLVAPAYGDGFASLNGQSWTNPRVISNALFAQDSILNDPYELSDYAWMFGQFMDHDLSLVVDQPNNFLYVQVPQGDPWFDPWGIGAALISMRRSQIVPGTGTGPGNPREHLNVITSYMDGSMVYGSSLEEITWLRSFEGGRMKVSSGNLLPYNTIDGEFESPIDPTAPPMDDALGLSPKLFVAGDLRVNENLLLISMHTLFVREHNRIADSLALAHADWTEEELFQHARRILIGIIQAITYEEWLPTLTIEIPPYQGYDPEVNPGIGNEFSAASFRLGHTLLNSRILLMDMEGEELPEGSMLLRDGFFRPNKFVDIGIEPLLKGCGIQMMQQADNRVIDDVRNFLFGPPGSGGLDLVTINITRGRERGIPDFNTVREAAGLPKLLDFSEMTSNPDKWLALEEVYDSPDAMDLWVGLLSEDPEPGKLFGPTLTELMRIQFQALRDGDRFYYENDPALSEDEKDMIKNTRLEHLICRNTDIPVMQPNVFLATPHEMLCNAQDPIAAVFGTLQTSPGSTVEGVTVEVLSLPGNQVISQDESDGSGLYVAEELATCEGYAIRPTKNDDLLNGVTTMDMVLVQRHILGVQSLDNPYQIIAADANKSNTITTVDLLEIRKVILFVSDQFANNTSWRFVEAAYEFTNPADPLSENFPESIVFPNLLENLEANFVAVKIGDVNFSAQTGGFSGDQAEPRADNRLTFELEDQILVRGQEHTVLFRADQIEQVLGFQYTLNYNTEALEFLRLRAVSLRDFAATNFFVMPDAGALTVSWNGDTQGLSKEDVLFSITFRAQMDDVRLCDMLTINSRYTQAMAYNNSEQVMDLALLFQCEDGPMLVFNKFELYQNIPNPVASQTVVPFYLPESSEIRLNIVDQSGRQIYYMDGNFPAGSNEILLEQGQLRAKGILFYQIETAFGNQTKKMLVLE